MIVDLARVRVKNAANEVVVNVGRLLFDPSTGSFSLWQDGPRRKQAHIFLRGTSATFAERNSSTPHHVLTLSDGTTYILQQLHGGGCGACSAYKGYGQETLMSDELTSIG